MTVQSSIQSAFRYYDEGDHLTIAQIEQNIKLSGDTVVGQSAIVAVLFNLQGSKIEGVEPAPGQYITDLKTKKVRWRPKGAIKNKTWGVKPLVEI